MKKALKLFILFIVLLSGIPVFAKSSSATDQRVFDDANLLSDSKEELLNDKCLEIGDKVSLDIVLLTIDDAKGKTSTAYADDFYDDMEFGYNAPNGDGVLLLIDMDNRELRISTSGTAISYITDSRIESLFDAITPYISDGEYSNGCNEFIDFVDYYMSNKPTTGNSSNNYYNTNGNYNGNSESIFLSWWFQFIIALVIAGIVVGVMAYNSGGKISVNLNTYLDASGTHHISSYDNYVKTVTTSVKKTPPSSSGGGSSTHKSSGGHTHGGGSRKF